MSETRPGWKTTEFWLVVLGNVLINVGAIDVGGAKYRGLFAILTVVGYSLARGQAKSGIPDGLDQTSAVGDEDDLGDDVPDVPLGNANAGYATTVNVGGTAGVFSGAGGPEPEGVPKSEEQSGD